MVDTKSPIRNSLLSAIDEWRYIIKPPIEVSKQIGQSLNSRAVPRPMT